MSYRDELEAAISRIKSLELAIGDENQETSTLVSANKSLRAEAKRLGKNLAEALTEIEGLRARLYGQPASPSEIEQLPTLTSYNRQLPAIAATQQMRVACPTCLTQGERVEMNRHAALSDLDSAIGITVFCTRCGTLGIKRQR